MVELDKDYSEKDEGGGRDDHKYVAQIQEFLIL